MSSHSAPAADRQHPPEREVATLLVSVLIVSACTVLYELLISTVSSYFLGSSVLHFSLTIGLFMFFLGVGSYLSKYVTRSLLEVFVATEIAIGFIGGLSAILLYGAYSITEWYYLIAFALIAALSTLAGLEIPVVTRIVREYQSLKDALAHILSFDYVGALLSSVLFPLLLLPYLGLIRTACIVGALNLMVAWVVTRSFSRKLLRPALYQMLCAGGVVVLGVAFAYSLKISDFLEQFLYDDDIVYSEQTPYQRIILTQHQDDVRLYLNGELQFSSVDEYRYHEALVHIPMSLTRHHSKVLVLGGGDGLAVREILKYRDVEEVTLVDLDEQMTRLGKESPRFLELNQRSLQDKRVTIINEDAWNFVRSTTGIFSVIIADLPDPIDFSLGKLYSREFYTLVRSRLEREGLFVTQSSSPYFAREAFWSVNKTLQQVFPQVRAYTAYVPTFGQWGFNVAGQRSIEPSAVSLNVPTRFLTASVLPTLFVFDKDTEPVEVTENRLDNQALVQYYESNWREIE